MNKLLKYALWANIVGIAFFAFWILGMYSQDMGLFSIAYATVLFAPPIVAIAFSAAFVIKSKRSIEETASSMLIPIAYSIIYFVLSIALLLLESVASNGEVGPVFVMCLLLWAVLVVTVIISAIINFGIYLLAPKKTAIANAKQKKKN